MNKLLSVFLIVSSLFMTACKMSKLDKHAKDADLWGHLLDTVTIAAAPSQYRESATRLFDLLHTKLEVSFDFAKQHLHGKAYLTLKPYFFPSDQLILDAKGFDIHQVSLIIGDGKLKDLPFEYKDSLQLCIQLPLKYQATDTIAIFIDYTAKPNERKTSGSRAIASDKGLYFINPDKKNPLKPVQIWTQGETEASSCWFPTIDKPNERTTAEICMTVPDTMTTLSNGLLTESSVHADGTKTECWTMTQPHAPYLFMMAVGKYAVVKDRWRGREISYYVEPQYEPYARNIFGNTPEMLEFFSSQLGVEYPWPKYAQVVVRDYVSGAMENTSASVFLEAIQTTDRERLDRNWDFIIAHELYHQWFGDLVTCESWSNLTLNEGFATYAEYLWNEHKYGKEEADYYLMNDLKNYLSEARLYQQPLIRFYYNEREEMFDSHSYEKGGLVLHMLRNHVGDDAFFKSLQHYLLTNQYKAVEAHHLRLAFEEVTGMDLNWFFNQWYFSAGHPRLTIRYEYDDTLKKQYLSVSQKPSSQKSDQLVYRLPVTIDIHTDTGIIQKEIIIDAKENRFAWEIAPKPRLVQFDANRVLLCEKEENKTDAEYIYQFRHGRTVIDRHEALLKLWSKQKKQEVRQIFTEALRDIHWSVREYALKKLDLDDSLFRMQYYETLKNMALYDSKPQVRAMAVDRLTEYAKEQQLDIYMRAIHDSSFLVAAHTLKALLAVDTPAALQYAQHFEAFQNSEITAAVGLVYAMAGKEDKFSFFDNALSVREGYALYALINSFTEYLLRMKEALVLQGVPLLKNIALNHDVWWLRSQAGVSLHDMLKHYRNKLEAKQAELKKTSFQKRAELESEISYLQQLVSRLEADFTEIKQSEREKKVTERYEQLN